MLFEITCNVRRRTCDFLFFHIPKGYIFWTIDKYKVHARSGNTGRKFNFI